MTEVKGKSEVHKEKKAGLPRHSVPRNDGKK